MNEDENSIIQVQSKVKDVIDAATGLVKAVPIYQDAIQPAAKEIGKSLETITKAINLALSPIKLLVWGYDQIQVFMDQTVAKKLEKVPLERIQQPDPHVVGPAIESLRYTGNNEILRDMFANLIANSLDSDTAQNAHPAFVDIIKNITSDEAKILKMMNPFDKKPIIDIKIKHKDNKKGEMSLFDKYSLIGEEAGCTHLDLVPNYFDNLCRLGLLIIPSGRKLVGDDAYNLLVDTELYKSLVQEYESENTTVIYIQRFIQLTDFGIQFQETCIFGKEHTEEEI